MKTAFGSCGGLSRAVHERSLRDRIVSRDRSTCQSCGRRTKAQVHHILPRRQGGPDTPANLVTLCGRCHMLISPIPVDVLCKLLRISVAELLVQKARVEIAVHSWVLAYSQKPGMETLQPGRRQGGPLASLVPQRLGFTSAVPEWKRLRPRAGKPWTKEDDEELLRDFDAGLQLEDIARRRERGVRAIEVRLYKLGRGR